MISKEILIQYSDLQEEIKEVRDRIIKTEEQISKIEDGGSVIDSVSGGSGGNQHFKIEGFPYPEYSRKRTLLYSRKAILASLEMELLETLNQVEEFLASVEDSRMRRIINFRFIDKLSWIQVAKRLDSYSTADGVRMEFNRFMEQK